MVPLAEFDEHSGPPEPLRRRRYARVVLLAVLVALAIGIAMLWINRATIADNVIASELDELGIEARYTVEQVGGTRQILRDVVVGDPARPDLTIERAEVTLRYRLGFPAIARVRLVRPRLFGTLQGDTLSFGALDPLLFTGEAGPFELPDFELALEDGRGLLESDHGPVAFKLAGEGHLRGGFAGELAALAPAVAVPGCDPLRVTLYGQVGVQASGPRFEGPLRFGRLRCPAQGFASAGGAVQLEGAADRALERIEGKASLRIGASTLGEIRLASIGGTSAFTWRDGGLTAGYELAAAGLAAEPVSLARLDLGGTLRARRLFERIELDAELDGRDLRPGEGLDSALADAGRATDDTLLGPLLQQVRGALAGESRASRLTASVTVRRTGERTVVAVPEARLRGGGGATLLALSRFQYITGGGAAPRFAGRFALGGANLPRVTGQLEQRPGGTVEVRLAMAEYRAGESRLAMPELVLLVRPGGALGFAGEVRASGALPGGMAENLVVQLAGNRSPAGEIALWRECTDLRFERLRLANVMLARQHLTLCPPRGSAIVRLGADGLRVAAGVPALELVGDLGETPIALRSGPVGIAYPGALSARRLDITLGPAATATRFAIADLTAEIGPDVSGRFDQADVRLFAVPLDLLGASGTWRYADGRLTLAEGAFRLEDRSDRDRFKPLVARGATLALENEIISAAALLREPNSDRLVTEVDLRHDLARGTGHADLMVPGLVFDETLQPTDLTINATGVVALVRGTVTGRGRIDWADTGVTSSGRFASDSLDFAAAFGPVKGASGALEFTDLLGLTTAPSQRLAVASINPGIEVNDGLVAIQIRRGEVLALQGGTWPFVGGTLTLRPIDIRFADANGDDPGPGEVRRYVLEVEALDAARFIERMELNNLAATGTFDGTVPIVFDLNGNGRLEGGVLLSRPPGGNLSYVGELTYEDLGAVADFAFDALRSLDYRQMRVGIDGPLTGEIVTRVRADGVSQGAGAAQNVVTRAIAGLPIRLDVNVRAPFFQLLGTARALYDPDAIRDPRSPEVGLLDADGNIVRRDAGQLPPAQPAEPDSDDNLIQRRESEELP